MEQKNLLLAVEDLKENIIQKYVGWTRNSSAFSNSTTYETKFRNGVTTTTGRKFIKIICDNSVWGFVALTDGTHKSIPYKRGDVFMAASWSAPAKHVRGTVFTDDVSWFDWTGPNYIA